MLCPEKNISHLTLIKNIDLLAYSYPLQWQGQQLYSTYISMPILFMFLVFHSVISIFISKNVSVASII